MSLSYCRHGNNRWHGAPTQVPCTWWTHGSTYTEDCVCVYICISIYIDINMSVLVPMLWLSRCRWTSEGVGFDPRHRITVISSWASIFPFRWRSYREKHSLNSATTTTTTTTTQLVRFVRWAEQRAAQRFRLFTLWMNVSDRNSGDATFHLATSSVHIRILSQIFGLWPETCRTHDVSISAAFTAN